MTRHVIFMIVALLSSPLHAAIVLQGDSQAASGDSFSFSINQSRMSNSPDLIGSAIYVAAAPSAGGAGVVNQFGVSRVARESTQFIGLTPELAKVNGSPEPVSNPLYDQGISAMALFNGAASILAGASERPVVTTAANGKTIYFINNYNSVTGANVEVISVQNNGIFINNVPDSNGAVTSGVVALESAEASVFAAVAPNGGTFGDAGSGIALSLVGEFPAQDNSKFTGPVIIDAPTGSPANPGGNRAAPINVTLDALKIGDNLASIGTVVDIWWFAPLRALYVALHVTGGAAGSDGARALLVGQFAGHGLTLNPIAPTTAFDTSGTQIVGAVGANSEISINKVRGMYASTALSYLIVQGGVGSPSATKRTVYALPLVSQNSTAALNGTIADATASPTNVFTPTKTPLFAQRAIITPATTPGQMPSSTATAALVGGGPLYDGDITDMFVYGDTVFVTVKSSDAHEKPGVFSSQAIFQADGKIKAWSLWKRATGTINAVQSVLLDPITGQFSFLSAQDGINVQTVDRTQWGPGALSGFAAPIAAINEFMAPEIGGIQGVFDFVVTATATNTATPGLHNISAVVATALGRIALIQTSSAVAGGVIPLTWSDFGTLSEFENGTITQSLPIAGSNMIGIIGGALADLGPITAAEFARDGASGSNGYLFVGGIGGLAVLSKADGSGWDATTGLSAGFSGLTAGMSFKKVGDYTNVAKIINDGIYLYVLTNSKLDRIDLTAGTVGLGQITPTTIAINGLIPEVTINGTFLDALISQQLLILATNIGLVRLSPGLDVRQVNFDTASWQRIPAPETVGPMQQLWPVTTTGRSQDATQGAGSYLIALSAYRGKNQAQIIRYEIQGDAVTRINDMYVQGIPSYFAMFGQFRALSATDGSIYYSTRNRTEDTTTLVTALFSTGGVQTGSRFLSNKVIPVQEIGSTIIAAMLQTSATGSWLVAGDGGMQANE